MKPLFILFKQAIKNIFIILILLNTSFSIKAQSSYIKWSYILDGYNDVDIRDLVTDSLGNTYAAVSYLGRIDIAGLKGKKFIPYHFSGMLIKINKDGKPVWAHGLKSGYQNEIRDIALAPNGDLLLTGWGDGVMHFPGNSGEVIVGTDAGKKSVEGSSNQNHGFFAARYSPDGDVKWVQYFDCFWGEGISIAANNRDEVYMIFDHNGVITQNGKFIDSFPTISRVERKVSMACFSGNGDLKFIKCLSLTQEHYPLGHLRFDSKDNLYLSGTFVGNIRFSEKDSLTNDGYYENRDSYLVKFNSECTLLWMKKIGGRDAQIIRDMVIDKDGSVYGTGQYYSECSIGNGVRVIQKNQDKSSAQINFFYFHLFEDGELDFIRFEQGKVYPSGMLGSSIALDQNGKVFIIGDFSDTLQISGKSISGYRHEYTGFQTIWEKNKLVSIEKTGESERFMYNKKIDINHCAFAIGGIYYGELAFLNVGGKKVKLSHKDYGRSSFIFGGAIPDDTTYWPPISSTNDSLKNKRIEQFESLLTCSKLNENPAPDNWFSSVDSFPQSIDSVIAFPCGQTVKGMEAYLYPNPTDKEVNIKLLGIVGKIQLMIYSSDGSLILSQQIEDMNDSQTITYDLSQLSSGTYYVQILHKDYQKALRFIKVK